jgi:hypothetical protein
MSEKTPPLSFLIRFEKEPVRRIEHLLYKVQSLKLSLLNVRNPLAEKPSKKERK